MRKLIYFTVISLDGFIARPGGELDWVLVDEELHKYLNDQQSELGAYLYGRRMYELMAAAWPPLDTDPSAPDYIAEFARLWKRMPKIVFSETLTDVAWNSRLVRGDAAAEVRRLKAEPGKDLEVGGAGLAGSLIKMGLVDEYRLFVQPAVLGAGLRVFPELRETINLKLVDTRAFASGVVYLRYEKA
jgi:dihydrofolate reductase